MVEWYPKIMLGRPDFLIYHSSKKNRKRASLASVHPCIFIAQFFLKAYIAYVMGIICTYVYFK